jgi:hypothetical protein
VPPTPPRYTLVHPDGSPYYVAPRAPGCPAAERSLAVYREDGAWGVVDRRTGRLLTAARPDPHRYPSWAAAAAGAAARNGGPEGPPGRGAR